MRIAFVTINLRKAGPRDAAPALTVMQTMRSGQIGPLRRRALHGDEQLVRPSSHPEHAHFDIEQPHDRLETHDACERSGKPI